VHGAPLRWHRIDGLLGSKCGGRSVGTGRSGFSDRNYPVRKGYAVAEGSGAKGKIRVRTRQDYNRVCIEIS
jgi:hypothetical protein